MTQHVPPKAMTLFDLIGRHWRLESGVKQALFNEDGTALMIGMDDDRLAFISAKDAESPDDRMRQEVDTGRMTVRPREKPLPPPVYSQDLELESKVSFCRYGEKGFAFVQKDSDVVWRATARGQTLQIPGTEGDEISALAALPGSAQIVVARGDLLEIRVVEGGADPQEIALSHDAEGVVPSRDGRFLACWGAGSMSLVDLTENVVSQTVSFEGKIASLSWSPCANWIVAGCRDSAILLLNVASGETDRITQFPQAVGSVDFSSKSAALLASGAFRIVGWELPDLPFGTHEGTPIETGRPGLTVVERIANHGPRDICAASYANGLVVACRAGQPDELMVHDGHGVSVQSMCWSGDGKHLAWGDVDGNLSIATFPKEMFK